MWKEWAPDLTCPPGGSRLRSSRGLVTRRNWLRRRAPPCWERMSSPATTARGEMFSSLVWFSFSPRRLASRSDSGPITAGVGFKSTHRFNRLRPFLGFKRGGGIPLLPPRSTGQARLPSGPRQSGAGELGGRGARRVTRRRGPRRRRWSSRQEPSPLRAALLPTSPSGPSSTPGPQEEPARPPRMRSDPPESPPCSAGPFPAEVDTISTLVSRCAFSAGLVAFQRLRPRSIRSASKRPWWAEGTQKASAGK